MDKLPVSFVLPINVFEPVVNKDPVTVCVPINNEEPVTTNEPLIIDPFDAVTDVKWAVLPLTINFFQLANYYSISLHISNTYKYGYVLF